MIELLAYCANMPLPQFVRAHTLMPYRRCVASHKPELIHGDENDRAMIRCASTRLARPGAYFCVVCVNKDIKTIGMSYWRRSHQLPGMYACPEHGQALRYVEKNNAFLSPPSTYVDTAYLIDDQWAVDNHAHPAIRRFLSLSQTLASGERPFEVRKIRPLLMQQAKAIGLRGFSAAGNGLLSDLIVETFPAQWLETIFPGLPSKPVGHKIDQIDGVLYLSTCSSSVAAYILAFCVLFDSPKAAMDALSAESLAEPSSRRRQVSESLSETSVDLKSEYVRTRGNHLRIARENGLELHTVINGLRDNGLPNLTTKGKDKSRLFDAVVNFYLGGQTMAESAIVAGVKLEDLERIVRHAGADLTAMLKRMVRISGATRAEAPLGSTRLPHLVQYLPD